MSGLNDWLDLSGEQQTAILQEDLDGRLAARRRRDAERAEKFAPRPAPDTSLSPLDSPAVSRGTSPPFPLAAGESNPFPTTERNA